MILIIYQTSSYSKNVVLLCCKNERKLLSIAVSKIFKFKQGILAKCETFLPINSLIFSHLLRNEKHETSSWLPKMNIYDGQRVMRHLWTKLECILPTYRTKLDHETPLIPLRSDTTMNNYKSNKYKNT